jgi:hypothetical protein
MRCQHFLRKSSLKPFGPGALSLGIVEITLSMSSFENGSAILCKSWLWTSSCRLNLIVGCIEDPSMFLYSSHKCAAFSACLERSLPSGVSRLVMVLNLNLFVAATWKNFVLSSLSLVDLTVYLFVQYSFWAFRSINICFLRILLKFLSCTTRNLFSSSLSITASAVTTFYLLFKLGVSHSPSLKYSS